jgi:hypothetical protein
MPFYLHSANGLLNGAFPWSFHAVSSSSATESAAQTSWDAGVLALWNQASLNPFIPTTVTLTQTSTSTANASFKQTTKTATNHSLAGTGTGALPYEIAEVITLRTAQATKYGHGRWYLPCLAPSALATGGYILSSAAQTAIKAGADALFTSITPTLTLQILHRRATLHGPGANTTDPVISHDIPIKFAVQRRRADKLVPSRL